MQRLQCVWKPFSAEPERAKTLCQGTGSLQVPVRLPCTCWPCRDTNKEIYEKICEMRAAYKAENDKYWEEEKTFRDWYREDRRRKCAPAPHHALLAAAAGGAAGARHILQPRLGCQTRVAMPVLNVRCASCAWCSSWARCRVPGVFESPLHAVPPWPLCC